ncbi:MAG: hypothetical protein ABJ387_01520 [Balneola sp.]
MTPKKVAVLGGAGAGPIRAAALIESILADRENPGLLIIPNLKNLDKKALDDIIKDIRNNSPLIVAGMDME